MVATDESNLEKVAHLPIGLFDPAVSRLPPCQPVDGLVAAAALYNGLGVYPCGSFFGGPSRVKPRAVDNRDTQTPENKRSFLTVYESLFSAYGLASLLS